MFAMEGNPRPLEEEKTHCGVVLVICIRFAKRHKPRITDLGQLLRDMRDGASVLWVAHYYESKHDAISIMDS